MDKFKFTSDQIENLETWKKCLTTERAMNWEKEEEEAEVRTKAILCDEKFIQGEDLSPEKLDELFSCMKKFCGNRNLSNLLYRDNDLTEFNRKLRNLIHDSAPFPNRVNDFFELKKIGSQTLSQFLTAANTREYPLISNMTKDAIDIDSEQDQAAQSEALSTFKIENQDDFLDRTLDYLKDFIIYQEIKSLLNLEKYTQVNNLLFFGTETEESGPEEAFKSFGSITIEHDLRDFLANNPSYIEKGFTLIGKEYDTRAIGRIDLLYKDNKGTYVVVELKKGRKSDEVVGQILRYIGWVQKELHPKVKGIIIVSQPEEKLEYAIGPIKDLIEIRFYKVKFEINKNYE
jgi:hypothetical protein